MALDMKSPIIIKKIKKGGHGFHGGAWKLAYADFVTAMMAFFLLMWLLGSTTDAQKKGIADYFQNPLRVSLSGGSTSGDTTSVVIGGGMDLAHDVGQVNMGNFEERKNEHFEGDTDQEVLDAKLLEILNKELQEAIDFSPVLNKYRDQLKIDITRDGLRVQLVDSQNRPMFPLSSTRLEPYAQQILKELTPIFAKIPNRIAIVGHTDATIYAANHRDYSNWELSSDRANTARRAMVEVGMPTDRVVRVSGMADTLPYDVANPKAAVNRRIAIIVLNKRAEQALLGKEDDDTGAHSGPDGVPAHELINDSAPPHLEAPK